MTVYNALPKKCPEHETAVALGMFDGLHLGHLAVLNALVDSSRDTAACVFTFSTYTAMPPAKTQEHLLSDRMRDRLLSDMGISYIFQPEFSDFRDMPPERFAKDFLVGYLNAKMVFCGEDFRFGKDAAASSRDLADMLGPRVRVIPEVVDSKGAVSTTRIRGLVRNGDMPRARRLLGRPFTIDFPVEHGRKLGRKLDWPTINQPFPESFTVPRFGVYASVADVDGERRASVTNVGVKPTVGGGHVLAETYIRGFSGDLYGQNIEVGLLEFIRPEQKFDSIETLRNQIEIDNRRAAEIGDALLKEDFTCTIY